MTTPADGPAPAAGERVIRQTFDGRRYVVYDRDGPDGEVIGPALSLDDARLLAYGRADLARLAAAIRDMLPLACCTCPKSPLGCVILTVSCPFCRARAALAAAGGGAET